MVNKQHPPSFVEEETTYIWSNGRMLRLQELMAGMM